MICLLASGYIGFQNFTVVESYLDPVLEMMVDDEAKTKIAKMAEPESDWMDTVKDIGEMLAPLIPIYLSRRKRKTLDDEVADVAEKMGVSPKTIRGKLGLGDRRRAKKKTTNTRRKKD